MMPLPRKHLSILFQTFKFSSYVERPLNVPLQVPAWLLQHWQYHAGLQQVC
jgi:hypothetical protein